MAPPHHCPDFGADHHGDRIPVLLRIIPQTGSALRETADRTMDPAMPEGYEILRQNGHPAFLRQHPAEHSDEGAADPHQGRMVPLHHRIMPARISERRSARILHQPMAGELSPGAAGPVHHREAGTKDHDAVHGRHHDLFLQQESAAPDNRPDQAVHRTEVPAETETDLPGMQVPLSEGKENHRKGAGLYGLCVLSEPDADPQRYHALGVQDGEKTAPGKGSRAGIFHKAYGGNAQLHGLVYLHGLLRVLRRKNQAVCFNRQD